MRGRRILSKSSMFFAGLALALAVTGLAAASSPPPVFDSSAMHGNEAEIAIAVNPTNTSNVVTMATLRPQAAAGIDVNVTFNSGRDWTSRVIGSTTSDPLGSICCDEQLAWDRFGNLWLTYLDETSFNVHVALSTDGGRSFTRVQDIAGNGDQPSISAGARSVWVSYMASKGSGNGQSKQIAAFGASVTGLGRFGAFTTPETVPGPNGNGDYGDTAVGPNGQVMVTYQKSTAGQGGSDVYTAVDPDGLGPAGFGAAVFVAHSRVGGFDPIPAEPDRTIDDEANLAWDTSGGAHSGRVYLVWTQESPNGSNNTDIELQHSDDSGATWSPAVKLNDDHTTNSQYLPAIALDQATGKVALSWYDTRNDLGAGGSGDTDGIPNDDFQVWGTYSTDGGATFAPNFRISPGTSNAVDAQNDSFDVGDYAHAAFVGGTFWPAWADNSNSTGTNPDGTLHQLDLYTAAIPIP
jgi:hypothetical protein